MSVLMLRKKDKVVKWSNMIGVLPAR